MVFPVVGGDGKPTGYEIENVPTLLLPVELTLLCNFGLSPCVNLSELSML